MNDKSFTASRWWWTLDSMQHGEKNDRRKVDAFDAHTTAGVGVLIYMPYIIWHICLYDIYWPRRKDFTLTVGRVVTQHSSRSEAVFVKRKCTGGTVSGSAHCGTEFMPGNSSQMISLHKCVKCPLKSAHNRLVYIFQWMKASFLRTTPWGRLPTAHSPKCVVQKKATFTARWLRVFYALWAKTFARLSF